MTKVQGGSCDNPLTSFSYHCILLHIEIFIAIGPIKKNESFIYFICS
jgi:hypothetical protein